jgi:hypothetical protein
MRDCPVFQPIPGGVQPGGASHPQFWLGWRFASLLTRFRASHRFLRAGEACAALPVAPLFSNLPVPCPNIYTRPPT